MLPLMWVCALLLPSNMGQALYLPLQIPSTYVIRYGRAMSSQMEPIVVSVEALDDDESESLDWVVDPSKALQPKDIFHDVQKFVVKIYEFVQHPKDSAYNGFAYSLQPIFKKHKQHNQQKQQATIHKVMLDPFGNFSFTLGFSLNFQVSNTVGFTKTR